MNKIIGLFFLTQILCAQSYAALQTKLLDGPVATALGGAGRAAVVSTESGEMNPATLYHLRGWHMGFIYGAESEGTAAGSNKYHFILSDASEDVAFPASVSYSQVSRFETGQNDIDERELRVAAGFKILDNLSMGVAAKRYSQEVVGRTGVKADYNGTVGFLYNPMRYLGFGLVFDDFIETREIAFNPLIGAGVHYQFRRVVRARLDVSQPQKDNPNRRYILAYGIESLFTGQRFKLRVGQRHDMWLEKRYVSTGLGWDGPRLALNYAYEKDIDREDFRHLIDMKIQF